MRGIQPQALNRRLGAAPACLAWLAPRGTGLAQPDAGAMSNRLAEVREEARVDEGGWQEGSWARALRR